MTEQATANQKASDQIGTFSIERIYIKDVSFESPRSPQTFKQAWRPELDLDLDTQHEKIGEDLYEVVLSLTVKVKNGEEPAFLCEVHQGGLFVVRGYDVTTLHRLLGSYCPSILFSYARELVDSLVVRGTFPAMMLAPINFDAMYDGIMKRRQQESSDAKLDNM
jgi:preprotein translocase subunit SecB